MNYNDSSLLMTFGNIILRRHGYTHLNAIYTSVHSFIRPYSRFASLKALSYHHVAKLGIFMYFSRALVPSKRKLRDNSNVITDINIMKGQCTVYERRKMHIFKLMNVFEMLSKMYTSRIRRYTYVHLSRRWNKYRLPFVEFPVHVWIGYTTWNGTWLWTDFW
jgi:hypothetical protein